MIRSLLALDPGNRTGYAFFILLGELWSLQAAGVVAPNEVPGNIPKTIDLVVIENPQIYPNSKARPADILKLARCVGRYEERYRDSEIQLPLPRDWKGTIDGDVFLKRIEANLPIDAVRVLAQYKGGYRHNAVDAIGLGFWALRQPFMRGRRP